MGKPVLKVLFFANTDWYLYNFRLGLANYLAARGMEVVMVCPPGAYSEKLKAQGYRCIPISMDRRSLNPFAEIGVLWRLFHIYRAEKPDIAHHFTVKCVVYGGFVAHIARVRNVVSAVTGLGYVFSGQKFSIKILRRIVRGFLKIAINGFNRILILQNPDDRQLFLRLRLVNDKDIRVIAGSGVNTQKFQPRLPSQQKTGNRSVKIVLAARLLWDKGLAEFVAASQLLNAEGIDTEFIIAGSSDSGNPAAVPENVLASWRLMPALTLLGQVSDMAALFSEVDIVVLPTNYPEGVPRSLIEAAAAGLPIVTTNTPGCREIVKDGVNGFLVPVRDSVKLADAIRKLVIDPELAVRMGAVGREMVLAEFDEQIVFERTLAVYRELNADF